MSNIEYCVVKNGEKGLMILSYGNYFRYIFNYINSKKYSICYFESKNEAKKAILYHKVDLDIKKNKIKDLQIITKKEYENIIAMKEII